MKAKQASDARKLEDIPNIGGALAGDLRVISITRPSQLKGKDGLRLYAKLNQVTGARHDPCVAESKGTHTCPQASGRTVVIPGTQYRIHRIKYDVPRIA